MSDLSGLSRLIGDAGSGEGDLSGLERDLSGGYQDLGSGSRLGGDAPPEESGGTTPGGPCGGAYSFSPDTAVATPHGQQSIGSLKVGDQVEAYNPTTGKPEAEPIQTIWVNHDHDLVDVHLAPASSSSSAATPVSLRTSDTSGHGRIIGDDATTTVRLATPSTTNVAPGGETIYTTANHPWLTADRGWVEAGQLQVGEPVVTLNGATGTVVWVYTVPGQADMYNLTVANAHTYAVGAGWWVVHNDNCLPNDPPVDAHSTARLLGKSAKEIPGNESPTVSVAWATDQAGVPVRLISVNEDAYFRLGLGDAGFGAWESEGTKFVAPSATSGVNGWAPGHAHAEYFLDQYMSANNLQLQGLGSSRNVCPACSTMLENSWGPTATNLIGTPLAK